MTEARITRSETPQAPGHITRRLREFDRRLEVRFNTKFCVWEVREFLATKGLWNHCFFWHDGPWNAMRFKPLPHTAEPLLAKLGSIDWARHGLNPKQRLAQLRDQGAAERARRLDQARTVAARKFREYAAWFRRNWSKLMRRYAMGGLARRDAVAEREDAYRDILREGKE